MRPSAEPASRPWSPSARVSANASAVSATVPPAGCGCVTTTGRTTWPTISSRRSPSSADSSPSFVREPEGGVAERFIRTLKENLLWVRSSKPSRNSAWPCSRSATYNAWRNTRSDATSLAAGVEANTVKPLQELWGATIRLSPVCGRAAAPGCDGYPGSRMSQEPRTRAGIPRSTRSQAFAAPGAALSLVRGFPQNPVILGSFERINTITGRG